MHRFAEMISHAVRKNNARFISFVKMKEAFKDMLGMDSNRLPYGHVCQVGDPVLRGRAMMIEPDIIETAEFQKVLVRYLISSYFSLWYTIRRIIFSSYCCCSYCYCIVSNNQRTFGER